VLGRVTRGMALDAAAAPRAGWLRELHRPGGRDAWFAVHPAASPWLMRAEGPRGESAFFLDCSGCAVAVVHLPFRGGVPGGDVTHLPCLRVVRRSGQAVYLAPASHAPAATPATLADLHAWANALRLAGGGVAGAVDRASPLAAVAAGLRQPSQPGNHAPPRQADDWHLASDLPPRLAVMRRIQLYATPRRVWLIGEVPPEAMDAAGGARQSLYRVLEFDRAVVSPRLGSGGGGEDAHGPDATSPLASIPPLRDVTREHGDVYTATTINSVIVSIFASAGLPPPPLLASGRGGVDTSAPAGAAAPAPSPSPSPAPPAAPPAPSSWSSWLGVGTTAAVGAGAGAAASTPAIPPPPSPDALLTLDVVAVLGVVCLTRGYHLMVVTRRSRVGTVGSHPVYTVREVEVLPLYTIAAPDAVGEGGRTGGLMGLLASVGLGTTDAGAVLEDRYASLLMASDVTQGHYFSYAYDLTRPLQHQVAITARRHSEASVPRRDAPKVAGDRMAVDGAAASTSAAAGDDDATSPVLQWCWNAHMLATLSGAGVAVWRWCPPLIHGYFAQVTTTSFGLPLVMTLLARRSCAYAGPRYLKRGVSEAGFVANEVETEQIADDTYGGLSSFVQLRGSVPVYWMQRTNLALPKPPIQLHARDPHYLPARRHFARVVSRYGAPVCILNLVKKKEKVPREKVIGREFARAVQAINRDLPPLARLQYLTVDYAALVKSKRFNLLVAMRDVGRWVAANTGIFSTGRPRARISDPARVLPAPSGAGEALLPPADPQFSHRPHGRPAGSVLLTDHVPLLVADGPAWPVPGWSRGSAGGAAPAPAGHATLLAAGLCNRRTGAGQAGVRCPACCATTHSHDAYAAASSHDRLPYLVALSRFGALPVVDVQDAPLLQPSAVPGGPSAAFSLTSGVDAVTTRLALHVAPTAQAGGGHAAAHSWGAPSAARGAPAPAPAPASGHAHPAGGAAVAAWRLLDDGVTTSGLYGSSRKSAAVSAEELVRGGTASAPDLPARTPGREAPTDAPAADGAGGPAGSLSFRKPPAAVAGGGPRGTSEGQVDGVAVGTPAGAGTAPTPDRLQLFGVSPLPATPQPHPAAVHGGPRGPGPGRPATLPHRARLPGLPEGREPAGDVGQGRRRGEHEGEGEDDDVGEVEDSGTSSDEDGEDGVDATGVTRAHLASSLPSNATRPRLLSSSTAGLSATPGIGSGAPGAGSSSLTLLGSVPAGPSAPPSASSAVQEFPTDALASSAVLASPYMHERDPRAGADAAGWACGVLVSTGEQDSSQRTPDGVQRMGLAVRMREYASTAGAGDYLYVNLVGTAHGVHLHGQHSAAVSDAPGAPTQSGRKLGGRGQPLPILPPDAVPLLPGRVQCGVVRTNCVDCMDRTNVAQLCVGVHMFGLQLQSLGLADGDTLEPSGLVVRTLMEMYEAMGDAIALQYGGSEANKKVTSEEHEDSVRIGNALMAGAGAGGAGGAGGMGGATPTAGLSPAVSGYGGGGGTSGGGGGTEDDAGEKSLFGHAGASPMNARGAGWNPLTWLAGGGGSGGGGGGGGVAARGGGAGSGLGLRSANGSRGGGGLELLSSLQRYYANSFTDGIKQASMNVLLGVFQPAWHAPPHVWELESDAYLHNPSMRPHMSPAVLARVVHALPGLLAAPSDDALALGRPLPLALPVAAGGGALATFVAAVRAGWRSPGAASTAVASDAVVSTAPAGLVAAHRAAAGALFRGTRDSAFRLSAVLDADQLSQFDDLLARVYLRPHQSSVPVPTPLAAGAPVPAVNAALRLASQGGRAPVPSLPQPSQSLTHPRGGSFSAAPGAPGGGVPGSTAGAASAVMSGWDGRVTLAPAGRGGGRAGRDSFDSLPGPSGDGREASGVDVVGWVAASGAGAADEAAASLFGDLMPAPAPAAPGAAAAAASGGPVRRSADRRPAPATGAFVPAAYRKGPTATQVRTPSKLSAVAGPTGVAEIAHNLPAALPPPSPVQRAVSSDSTDGPRGGADRGAVAAAAARGLPPWMAGNPNVVVDGNGSVRIMSVEERKSTMARRHGDAAGAGEGGASEPAAGGRPGALGRQASQMVSQRMEAQGHVVTLHQMVAPAAAATAAALSGVMSSPAGALDECGLDAIAPLAFASPPPSRSAAAAPAQPQALTRLPAGDPFVWRPPPSAPGGAATAGHSAAAPSPANPFGSDFTSLLSPDLALYQRYCSFARPAGLVNMDSPAAAAPAAGGADRAAAASRLQIVTSAEQVDLFRRSVTAHTCSINDVAACGVWQRAMHVHGTLEVPRLGAMPRTALAIVSLRDVANVDYAAAATGQAQPWHAVPTTHTHLPSNCVHVAPAHLDGLLMGAAATRAVLASLAPSQTAGAAPARSDHTGFGGTAATPAVSVATSSGGGGSWTPSSPAASAAASTSHGAAASAGSTRYADAGRPPLPHAGRGEQSSGAAWRSGHNIAPPWGSVASGGAVAVAGMG
jgi:hypothetical protein